ncbi:MAG: alkaline phosphatase PhoX, partial [Nisaea sp.]
MQDIKHSPIPGPDHDMSFDEWDEATSPSPDVCGFDIVVESAMSRRGFLGALTVFGASSFLMGTSALTPVEAATRLSFEQVAANTLDTITVPKGYNWNIVTSWGQPLWSRGADFDQSTRGTGETQEMAFGDNNDGMALFVSGGKNVLAVNNEYTNRSIIYGARESKLPENPDDVRKGKAAHGVSVMEVEEQDGRWHVVVDSPLNRRITADTP